MKCSPVAVCLCRRALRNRLSSPAVMILKAANSLGYPLVVKPAEQGSSVGVTIVQQPTNWFRLFRMCFNGDHGFCWKSLSVDEKSQFR